MGNRGGSDGGAFQMWLARNVHVPVPQTATFEGLGPEFCPRFGAGRYHAPREHNSAKKGSPSAVRIRAGPSPRRTTSSGCSLDWAHTWQKKTTDQPGHNGQESSPKVFWTHFHRMHGSCMVFLGLYFLYGRSFFFRLGGVRWSWCGCHADMCTFGLWVCQCLSPLYKTPSNPCDSQYSLSFELTTPVG